MATCCFCDRQIAVGTGFTLFKRDGSALHYCSGKCEKNFEMGRKPSKFKWSGKFVKGAAVQKGKKKKKTAEPKLAAKAEAKTEAKPGNAVSKV
jgi:large subunit ribosomal protein L24e